MEQEGRHIGIVTEVTGDMAEITFVRSPMCKHCGSCMAAGDTQMKIKLKNELNAEVGDSVEIELKVSSMLLASVLCYVVPLVLLIGGVLLGSLWNETVSLILGIALCASSFVILKTVEKKRGTRFTPRMKEIITEV